MPKPKQHIDITKLENLYLKENLTAREIASIFNTSHTTILYYLRLYKIPRRRSGSIKGKSFRKNISKEQLEDLYINQDLSVKDISKKIKKIPETVLRYIHYHKIPLKPKPKKSDAELTFESNGGYRARKINGKKRSLHRVVAEKVLGRELTREEVVHHDDRNRINNDPNNLWIFPDHSSHAKYHRTGIVHPLTIFLKDYIN